MLIFCPHFSVVAFPNLTPHCYRHFILFLHYLFSSFLIILSAKSCCFPHSCISIPAFSSDSQLVTCPSTVLLVSSSSSGTTIGYMILMCPGLL